VREAGAGFGHDTNKITIIDRSETVKEFDLKAKNAVATDIINEIQSHIDA
jgi:phosphopantothenoylcysteine decarboxylase/phosphopantothenate--cysteine ligase